jgi:hypothetical protein
MISYLLSSYSNGSFQNFMGCQSSKLENDNDPSQRRAVDQAGSKFIPPPKTLRVGVANPTDKPLPVFVPTKKNAEVHV